MISQIIYLQLRINGDWNSRAKWVGNAEAQVELALAQLLVGTKVVDKVSRLGEFSKPSETGKRNAQYLPNVNNKVIEKEALEKGHIIDNGNNDYYFIYDPGKVIGYDNGQPTSWIRAELTSGDVYHGHPIAGDRLNKYLRKLDLITKNH